MDLISCILPTRNRRGFAHRAMHYFLRQTYTQSELIVLDDGANSIEDLCADNSRIKYIKTPEVSIGEKLNIGIEQAQGEVIQKLDDDDYYHPNFLRTAIKRLRDCMDSIVAWDCFLIHIVGEKHLHFSGHGWSAGGTLCFARNLWERIPFRNIPCGEDWWFKKDHGERIARVCEPEMYILSRHGKNTWNVRLADEVRRGLKLRERALRRCLLCVRLADEVRRGLKHSRAQ